MPVVDALRTLVMAGIATGVTLVPPSTLMLDDIPGFELASEPATDLSYAGYAELEPESVAHMNPDSAEAAGLLAAMEIWTDPDSEQNIVVELVRAIDDAAATTFVDRAAAASIAIGLAATDPPFGGAWSYSGEFGDTWTNLVAWNQGPYAVTITHSARSETDRATIDAAAVRQVEKILDVTGAEVSADAAVDDDAPTAPTEPTAPGDDEPAGAFPVGTMVLVLAVVAVAVLVMLRQRQRYPEPS